jgi:hypothetical protein
MRQRPEAGGANAFVSSWHEDIDVFALKSAALAHAS